MISIICVSMARRNYLKLFLRSVVQNTCVPYEILLWVNGKEYLNTLDFLDDYPVRVYSSDDNIGLSIPYNRMMRDCKYDHVWIADDDMYMMPGWTNCLEEMGEHGWRVPMQIEPIDRNRGITANYGYLPNFQENKLMRDFEGRVYPKRHICTFMPCVISKQDYWYVGGYNEKYFCGEFDFLVRAKQQYEKWGYKQLNHPTSFFYHFRVSNVGDARSAQFKRSQEEMVRDMTQKYNKSVKELDTYLELFNEFVL